MARSVKGSFWVTLDLKRRANLWQRCSRGGFARSDQFRGFVEIVPEEIFHVWVDNDVSRSPPLEVRGPLQNGERKADHIHDALRLAVVRGFEKYGHDDVRAHIANRVHWNGRGQKSIDEHSAF